MDPFEAALSRMAADDPDRAKRAEWMFESLTAGEGLETVTQARLQDELWYRMPRKWMTDADDGLVLLDRGSATHDELDEEIAAAVADLWRDAGGSPPTARIVGIHKYATLRPARLIGAVRDEYAPYAPTSVSVADEAGVREALRVKAIGPKHRL